MSTPRPRRSELLMPAGSLRRLKTAILYGADAVYAGTPDLSLRTKSAFTLDELVEGVAFCHERRKRIYLTLNLFSHKRDIEKLPAFLDTIRRARPDGVIVADPGVFQYLKDHAPELERHISTQANVCSSLSVDFWQQQGADLVVLAREVSFDELTEIRQRCPGIKLETFVHGAMCMTYSGRCLLSNYMTERGANQGSCAHSCRWNYKLKIRLKDGRETELELNEHNQKLFDFLLEEEFRPGQLFPIEEDDRGSYILNAKDLCLMPKLNQLLEIGIDSLKVEGRNKSEYYAAITARAYRHAIDAWYRDPESWDPERYLRELYTLQNRGFSLAFHTGRLTNLAHDYESTQTHGNWKFGGVIREWQDGAMVVEVRNEMRAGDVLEFLPPGEMAEVRLRLYEFTDASSGELTAKLSAGQGKAIRIPVSNFHAEDPLTLSARLPALTVARKETPLSPEQRARLESSRVDLRAERGLTDAPTMPRQTTVVEASTRTPKVGVDGCCARGCNGCLPFWSDAKYAKARERLAALPIGRRLD